MVWIFLLILAAGFGVLFYYALKADAKRIAEGKVIHRSEHFMENAEEFILSAVDPEQVTSAVQQLDYTGMQVSMRGNREDQRFDFTGGSWSARLWRISADETQAIYRFQFLNWKTRDDLAQGGISMNMLTTAIEKFFLALDPNTQVRTVPLELKTKRSLL